MLRSSATLIAVVAVAGGGCGTDDGDVARTGSNTASGLSERTIVARAKLRTGEALGPQAHGEPFPGYAFTGPEVVTVELARAADGSFTLIVDSDTAEPHTIVMATGTCEGYAERYESGEKLYGVSGLTGDSPEGGDAGERHELPLAEGTVSMLLTAAPVTVFGDAGGAHGGDYIFCGTLTSTSRP